MTPAVKFLSQRNLVFMLYHYSHDASEHNYGKEAAKKLNINIDQIFKTLVVQSNTQQLLVAIVPVSQQLHCKKMAKAVPCKKIKLAEPILVERSTGYILGGVSPIGQKNILPTWLDSSALNFSSIFISGGKRGLEIEIAVKTLLQVVHGKITSLV
jgi:Cys-tRNA(Pro)/Cys-tRNA(Cys) deacylase